MGTKLLSFIDEWMEQETTLQSIEKILTELICLRNQTNQLNNSAPQ